MALRAIGAYRCKSRGIRLPPEPNRYNPFSVSCIESRICSTFGDAWPAGGSATRTVTVAGVKTHFGRV